MFNVRLGNMPSGVFDLNLPAPWNVSSQGAVDTSNAVATDITNLNVPLNGILVGVGFISASVANGTDSAAWIIPPAIFSKALGVLSLVTPVGPVAPSFAMGPTSAAWRIEYVAVGSSAILRVTGAAATNVRWYAGTGYSYNAFVQEQ